MTTITPSQALEHLRAMAAGEAPNCVNLDVIERVIARTRSWIPCAERLPKCPLIHRRTGHEVSSLVLVAKGDEVLDEPHYLRSDGQWFALGASFDTPGITHWTPYPPRP